MTPIQLHKRLDALAAEQFKRKVLRKLLSHAIGFAWLGAALAIPLLIGYTFPHQYVIAHYAAAFCFGGVGWALIVRILDSQRSEYWLWFAQWVFGSYSVERDVLGSEMDLDFALSDPVTVRALVFTAALEAGVVIKFNGEPISRVFPFTVGNSANPRTGCIYVRTRNATYQFGPSWFYANLNAFELEVINPRDGNVLKGEDWLDAHLADFIVKIPGVLNQWYVGRKRTLDQFFI